MFFEPPSAEDAPEFRIPETPPWSAPPAWEAGATVAVDLVVARSAHVVVTLPEIRSYSTGCMLRVDVVTRPDGLPDDEWWDLHMGAHGFSNRRGGGDRLPDRLLRLGVRFPDGAKATTLDRQPRGRRATDPPAGPLLTWSPIGGGTRGGGGLGFTSFGLWLWPLPPAEAFELAVEWPLGGIELTFAGLDGAAIATAAARSARYWPD